VLLVIEDEAFVALGLAPGYFLCSKTFPSAALSSSILPSRGDNSSLSASISFSPVFGSVIIRLKRPLKD
jgi:hypothetical protein